nr:helix-turn-helix transcriptional regulator [Nocardioides ochotonae]
MVEADEGLLNDLIRIRDQKKLSQEVVAARMEISQSAVARIESGERDPRLSTLRRYAMAVGAVYVHHVVDDEAVVPRTAGGQHTAVDWPQPEKKLSRDLFHSAP